MTEGTTRLLETPEPKAPFGQEFYEHHGSLAQATSHIPAQAAQTSRSLEPIRKSTNWVLISAITVAVLAMLALMIVTLRNRPTKTETVKTVTVPQPPSVTRPDVPSVPAPPPPAPPRGLPQGSAIGREFIYPGSETTMEINSATEGMVLQLHTKDSFDRVVAWYTEKIKPASTVRTMGPSGMNGPSVILEGDGMTAIINEAGGGTNIMLTQGGD